MGTASTMACIIETMGLCLTNASCVPAVFAERLKLAEQTGEVAARIALKKIKTIKKINEELYKIIMSLGNWCHPLESCWLVASEKNSVKNCRGIIQSHG